MTDSSDSLASYREILLSHEGDEAWELRVRDLVVLSRHPHALTACRAHAARGDPEDRGGTDRARRHCEDRGTTAAPHRWPTAAGPFVRAGSETQAAGQKAKNGRGGDLYWSDCCACVSSELLGSGFRRRRHINPYRIVNWGTCGGCSHRRRSGVCGHGQRASDDSVSSVRSETNALAQTLPGRIARPLKVRSTWLRRCDFGGELTRPG